MPQLSAMVLKDHANADHTFAPKDITGGVATLVESTGVPIGERRLSISTTRTAQGRVKCQIKLVLPVVQDVVVAGISQPTVVRTAYADLSFSFDGRSNPTERKDALAYVESLLGLAPTESIVGDVSSFY